ncbi:MAG: hypothetical protein AAF125_25375, partial [Chloroflexota bacterium]
AAIEHHSVGREDEMAETIMMGLRLLQEGIAFTPFHERFGVDIRDLRSAEIANFVQAGFLEQSENRLRLTPAGRFVSNRILRDLI